MSTSVPRPTLSEFIVLLLSVALAKPLALPLENTTVDVLVSGPYAELTIEQTFSNPNEEFIEAIYSFPLHQEAAVDQMWMRFGDRIIEGKVHEREEAKKLYEEAKEAGNAAALSARICSRSPWPTWPQGRPSASPCT